MPGRPRRSSCRQALRITQYGQRRKYPPPPMARRLPSQSKQATGASTIRFPFGVAPDGGIVMHCGGDVDWKKDAKLYPGRLFKAGGWVVRYDGKGKLVTDDLLPGLPLTSAGIHLDLKGNLYLVLALSKLVDGKEISVCSLVKFPPTGGRFMVNGKGVPMPLAEIPARPPDFKHKLTIEGDEAKVRNAYGDKVWAEGMLWSNGAVFPPVYPNHCHCVKGFFDLDRYARSFLPEAHRQSISVVDSSGNFILRLGEYANVDDKVDGIPIAFCRNVGVNDTHLYVDDVTNGRLLKVALLYEKEKELPLKP